MKVQYLTKLTVSTTYKIMLTLSTHTSWRRKWQPTPVVLPEKFHGQRSLGNIIVQGVAKIRT